MRTLRRRSFLAIAGGMLVSGARQNRPPRVEVEVLGTAQDAGLPHFACNDHVCGRARNDLALRQRVSCLGIRTESSLFLVDATPDVGEQLFALQAGRARERSHPLDGILLTHAHIGHYLGLALLGRESVAARRIPVYCTPRFVDYLAQNGPWSLLVSEGHVEPIPIEPGRVFPLDLGLNVEAIAVPHRDEFSDTVGYLLSGPERRLLYIPDVDHWEPPAPPIERLAERADILLLDGSFFDPGRELPGRDPSKIPHPPIPETMERLAPYAGRREIYFIHINHTNPVWEEDSAERRRVVASGFGIARQGQTFVL